ncbi:TRAP transporter substrate-binding protein DctP [Pelagibacterium mangrovi]|uniref:TRAP transporter substrate-binding protein DctP n=1 Tax=Pelagibacterium mangrovi TaxID=3119828 RepID=UPI002FC6A881
MTRRAAMLGAVALTMLSSLPAMAQDAEKQTLRFSAVFSNQDIRASMTEQFGDAISERFTLEPFYGGTLFRQGTELVAIQRGNLEMGNVAPQDIANQIPAWSMISSAYLFRDIDHVHAFFASEIGQEFSQMAEEQLGIHIIGPTYFGTRHAGLAIDREIQTPEDMSGVTLRMPGGEAWQFLGSALGANPTPMDYAEVYTGLQTGAIDGQDNPLPNIQNMRFYEVLDQIVLTSHLVAFDLYVISSELWNSLSPEDQQLIQDSADAALAWSEEQHQAQEAQLIAEFEEAGLNIYEPDIDAFRAYAQQLYLDNAISESWPEGAIDAVNAL